MGKEMIRQKGKDGKSKPLLGNLNKPECLEQKFYSEQVQEKAHK